MSRYKLTVDSLVRQREQRIIKNGREAMILDEVIRLREIEKNLLDALSKAQAKSRRTTKAKKQEAPDASDNPLD